MNDFKCPGLTAAARQITVQDWHNQPQEGRACFTIDTTPLADLLASSSGRQSVQTFLTSSSLYFTSDLLGEDPGSRSHAQQNHALAMLAFCNDVENYTNLPDEHSVEASKCIEKAKHCNNFDDPLLLMCI